MAKAQSRMQVGHGWKCIDPRPIQKTDPLPFTLLCCMQQQRLHSSEDSGAASSRVPGPKNNAHLSPVQNLQLITFTTISVVWASCARGWLITPACSSGGYIAARTFENQLHPITLATHADRTLIDHCLQNGGFFTFLVYINCRKNYNEGSDSKLTHKLLYCKSITKSKKN